MPVLPSSKDCCACAACVDVCPEGALSLVEDKCCCYSIKGDSNKCVDCKLCEKQCQILHPEKLLRSDPITVRPIAAWSTTEELIKYSATGGVFAQVACNMLRKGDTYVYGASLLDDNTVKHIEISDEKDVCLLQNSKYQQSVCTGIYKQAKKRLKEGRWVLFSGVPCQVAALYSFLEYKKELIENLYTIEVLCHGVPCNDIHRTSLKVNNANRIYAYRNKDERGWNGKNGNNNRVSYIGKDGRRFIVHNFQRDSLFRSYLTSNFTRENCYHCPYSDVHRVADLTIGDFWGCNKTSNPERYENYWGTSIVLPNTDKGNEMMQGQNLVRVETTWREFLPINPNLYMPTNANDYNGCKYMPVVKHLPASLKNVIYQGGFFNRTLDKLFSKVLSIIFRKHRNAARDKQIIRAEEILSYLETGK